jgi:hypothetical protein
MRCACQPKARACAMKVRQRPGAAVAAADAVVELLHCRTIPISPLFDSSWMFIRIC